MIDVAFLIDLSPRCRFRHFSENRSRRVCGLILGLGGWVSAMTNEGSLMWAGLAGVVPGSEVAVRFRGDAGWPTSSDEDEADWIAGAPPGADQDDAAPTTDSPQTGGAARWGYGQRWAKSHGRT